MEASGAAGTGMMILWIVVLFGMINSLEVGDSIVTTSGFYGVVIDMTEEDVIVEFGNNKNCRIPMRKQAIAEVEKAEQASA